MLTTFYTIRFPAQNDSEGVCGMFDIFSHKRDSDRESLQIIVNPGFRLKHFNQLYK